MAIKQLSVFLENTTGRLTDFTKVLKDNGIDMKALFLTETTDFGIIRCLVEDPEKVREVLSKNNFNATITDVLAVETEDVPGGLHRILEELTQRNIPVEYTYSAVQSKEGKAILIIKVKELVKAKAIFKEAGIKMYGMKDLL